MVRDLGYFNPLVDDIHRYFNEDLRHVYDGVWQGLKQKYLPLVVESSLTISAGHEFFRLL